MKTYLSPLLYGVGILLLMIACKSDDSVSESLEEDLNEVNNETQTFTPCENGKAGLYPCSGYDLLGKIPLSDFEASSGNDVWGWTDPDSGNEYALMGLDNGVAFIDITDTENLKYLGKLPTATEPSSWRDVKVFQNHAFVVSEAENHGMQVFDLTRLRDVTNIPVTFDADARYTGFGNAHNIVINEQSGIAYPVGTARNDVFAGGAHFIDINNPKNPVGIGGYADSGYTHDAQVVTYTGPDIDYQGREIFIGSNENQVVIADVTDKNQPFEISTVLYPNIEYTHQGWFTENQRFFILGDELDEQRLGFNSRTLIFDMNDLDDPLLFDTYTGPTAAIDHNGYVKGNEYFLANYTAGIRVLDISNMEGKTIREVGYFDTYPISDNASFNGAWSNFPFFESGKILVSDINSGLYIIKKSN